MKITELKSGSLVFIDVTRQNENFSYSTQLRIFADGRVSVVAPLHAGRILLLLPSDEVYIRVNLRGKITRWKLKSWKYSKSVDVYLIDLVTLGDVESYNRRGAYRVVMEQNIQMKRGKEVFEVQAKDLSLAGVGFETGKEFALGDNVVFSFNSDFGEIVLEASIVRVIPQKDGVFHYGAALVGKENPRLAYLIHRRQQEELRKQRENHHRVI